MSRRDRDDWDGDDRKKRVPPMNERPYYMKRVENLFQGRRVYDYQRSIESFNLDTLKMIDAHEKPSDFTSNMFRNVSEDELRSALLMATHPLHQGHDLSSLIEAAGVLRLHHKLEDDDFTKLHEDQVEMLSAAAFVLVKTRLGDTAPPKLTYFVMERPEEAEAITAYLEKHHPNKSKIHRVDLDHLEDYLNDEVTSLREGTL